METRTAACLSGMSTRQQARQSALPSRAIPTSVDMVLSDMLLGADRDSHYRHPSFLSDADVDTFQERNLFRRRGIPVLEQHHGFGGVSHDAAVVMASRSRRRKAAALIVFVVTPIRPRETSSMCAKAFTPSLSNSSRQWKRTLQPRSQRQGEQHRPQRVALLDPTGASDRPGLPGAHPEFNVS